MLNHNANAKRDKIHEDAKGNKLTTISPCLDEWTEAAARRASKDGLANGRLRTGVNLAMDVYTHQA